MSLEAIWGCWKVWEPPPGVSSTTFFNPNGQLPAKEERQQSHGWCQRGRGEVRAGALSGSLRERMERKRSGDNRAYSALGALQSISSHPFGLSTMPGGGPYSLHS